MEKLSSITNVLEIGGKNAINNNQPVMYEYLIDVIFIDIKI